MYYYEEKDFSGNWRPKKSLEKPIKKNAESQTNKIRNVRELAEEEEDLTLKWLYMQSSVERLETEIKELEGRQEIKPQPEGE